MGKGIQMIGRRKKKVLWSVSLIEGGWRTHLDDLILAQATVGIHLEVGQDLYMPDGKRGGEGRTTRDA